MNLTPLLLAIQNSVSDIPRLNSGGCAIFAGAVARRLEKMGIPVAVRVAKWGWEDGSEAIAIEKARTNNARRPYEWNKNGVVFGHLVLEIENDGNTIHFDSENLTGKRTHSVILDMPLYPGYLTSSECLLAGRYKSGWNDTFDRKQIRKMIKRINSVFARADEYLERAN